MASPDVDHPAAHSMDSTWFAVDSCTESRTALPSLDHGGLVQALAGLRLQTC